MLVKDLVIGKPCMIEYGTDFRGYTEHEIAVIMNIRKSTKGNYTVCEINMLNHKSGKVIQRVIKPSKLLKADFFYNTEIKETFVKNMNNLISKEV